MHTTRNRRTTGTGYPTPLARPRLVLSLVCGLAVIASPVRAQETFTADPYSALDQLAGQTETQFSLIKRVVKAVRSSVVHIEAKKRQKTTASSGVNQPSSYIEEAGSGVVFQHRGRNYIVTNYHVVEGSSADDIRIECDGVWFQPTRVIHDRETDLSVLFVDQTSLVPARIGDSQDVEIGDFVIAIGSPFGLSHSVSYGIVSALGRRDLDLGPQGVRFQDFMQTDAAINPGNSGGPLINLRGQVVGINTAIASNSGGSDGIGFSIPINMALRIATDLIEYGTVQRGFLGVSLDARFTPQKAISMGLSHAMGARISAITPGSPAEQANLQIGDIVVKFNDKPIANDSHLVTLVSLVPIGQQARLVVLRRGELQEVTVTIGDRRQMNR